MKKNKIETEDLEDLNEIKDAKKLTKPELKHYLALMNVEMNTGNKNKEYYLNLFNENINDYLKNRKFKNIIDSETITKKKRKRDESDLSEERNSLSKFFCFFQ